MRIALLTPAAAVVFAACVAPTPGTLRGGPDPVNTRYINPGTLAALPGFTHAVKVGPTVYVSGEVSLDSTGQLVGPGDLRAQATQAFANLATVLRIAGVTPAEVAKLTIYVVNAKPTDLDVIRAAAPDPFGWPPCNRGADVWGPRISTWPACTPRPCARSVARPIPRLV